MTDEIRKQLNENPYPQNIKEKVLEELARYEMIPTSSGESGVIKTYIDWLMKLPWWQMSQDNDDLNLAQSVLEADHYGLKKVKERIFGILGCETDDEFFKGSNLMFGWSSRCRQDLFFGEVDR